MTVYVDNFRAPATIGRIKARWSHLTADTPDELHAFAASIGQKREWFQGKCKYGKCPTIDGVCAHFHYDVVDSRRTAAIAAGAMPIDIREMGALVSARRPFFRGEPDLMTPGMPDPCQPIGCDNGFHLPGCTYADTAGGAR